MNQKVNEALEMIASAIRIELKEDQIICPTCKGVTIIQVEDGNSNYIKQCPSCRGRGIRRVCKHCGKTYEFSCLCDKSQEEQRKSYMEALRQKKESEERQLEDLKRKALRIENFSLLEESEDINGLFINGVYYEKDQKDRIKDVLKDIAKKNIDNKYVPLFFVSKRKYLEVDIEDRLKDEADDLIEDGSEMVDDIKDSEDYQTGIKLLNKAIKDSNLYVEEINYGVVVDLSDMYNDIVNIEILKGVL